MRRKRNGKFDDAPNKNWKEKKKEIGKGGNVDETQKKEISRERKTCFAHKNLGTEHLKQNTTWAILDRIAGQRAKR